MPAKIKDNRNLICFISFKLRKKWSKIKHCINYTIFLSFCQIKNISRIFKIIMISKIEQDLHDLQDFTGLVP